MRRRRREHRNWFPPTEATLKRTQPTMRCRYFQEVALHVSRRLPATVGMAPPDVMVVALSFASLSSPSSLANSCAFSIGVRRNIRNLVRSTLATILGRRGRVLFLVRLKNRRDFSPNSLCLSCSTHGSGGILFIQEERKLGTSEEFQG